MKKILPAALVLIAMCYYAISQAQTQTQDQAQPQNQIQPQTQTQAQTPSVPATEDKAQLDQRFTGCMNNKDCSTQARLQIIQEENDAMNSAFQKIHQACADANFKDCLDNEKDDVQAWYSAQDNMRSMMTAAGAQDMNGKEPAAGAPSPSTNNGQQKSWWQKIWPFGKNDTDNTGTNVNTGNGNSQ